MTPTLNTMVYPVRDLAAAKATYTALLGVEPHTDQPYYVGFRVGEQEIGLDPNGAGKGITMPVGYWHVADIVATRQALLDSGATAQGDITQFGDGGRRIATVVDADGNVVGILQD